MMTIDQREKQTRLQARMDELRAEMDELRAEIAFAQKGEKPWPYRSCLMREGRGYCENTVNIVRIYWCGSIVMARTEKNFMLP